MKVHGGAGLSRGIDRAQGRYLNLEGPTAMHSDFCDSTEDRIESFYVRGQYRARRPDGSTWGLSTSLALTSSFPKLDQLAVANVTSDASLDGADGKICDGAAPVRLV